ncbi:MAG TPA: dTMP kinase, partial [Candidatus Binataceae bacterium]|nr:dTMP kinase [Candidatus Binataceae bacterium]
LANSLRLCGHRVVLTREPGGTRTGELIRAIFLDSTLSLTTNAELLLVLADRAQHVQEKLRPALDSGEVVISDRYSDSTVAYQGYGRGLDLKLVDELNRLSSSGVTPDLTLLLDCPAEMGLARTRLRAVSAARTRDRFEEEDLEFHRRVRNGFLSIAGSEPSRVVPLDGSRNQDEVSTDVLRLVLERVKRR